ncbi:MAG: hypothetical protein IT447_12955 [Phycisphaerales bacterium]|jgi:hypothetical protein|nr:hypothetical protein [Phycisphaerales bacterium]
MANPPTQVDVLVLGEHPSAYLSAALLRQSGELKVFHCTLPAERSIERLVVVNPMFYSLHQSLAPLRRKIKSTPIHGLQFLGELASEQNEYSNKSAVALICSYRQIRDALADLAKRNGVQMARPRSLDIGLPDEQGVLVKAGSQLIHANILVVACELPRELRRPLGIADAWDRNLMQRYSFITLQPDSADRVSRPLMPMSLDLKGTSAWAWMLPGREQMQLAVQQPLLGADQVKPCELLRHWAMVLGRHGLLQQSQNLSFEKIQSIDFPAAAALEVDGVANRTLLIGPAGGFYSAGGEDIYPNCWSAIHAADVIRKALKQPHLQDALQPYRTRWRTTLGEYLRGPQQNLRFLLPLAYRNPKMSSRLAESILQGKSLVR